MLRSFEDLIGKPFQYGGRGPDSYDCYGLCREMYRRTYDRELPEAVSTTDDVKNGLEIMNYKVRDWHWKPVLEPKEGLLVLFRLRRFLATHVAFMLDSYRFIHTTAQTNGVCVERLDHPAWQQRVAGFYEYVGR